MEYQIEVFLRSSSGPTYAFVTQHPFPTKRGAEAEMNDMKLEHEDLNFRVIPALDQK